MSEGKLFFMMGLARSGKSTYAKKWGEEKSKRVVLTGDSFRHAIYDRRFSAVGEELVRASLITAARALVLSGYEVLIDETNTSEASVRHILNIDPLAHCIYVDTSADVCIKRALDCGHTDLPPSIQRMAKNLSITLPKIHRCEIAVVAMSVVSNE